MDIRLDIRLDIKNLSSRIPELGGFAVQMYLSTPPKHT